MVTIIAVLIHNEMVQSVCAREEGGKKRERGWRERSGTYIFLGDIPWRNKKMDAPARSLETAVIMVYPDATK